MLTAMVCSRERDEVSVSELMAATEEPQHVMTSQLT